ncbi:glutaredoxin family protein [Alteromonas mediterranea]|jgi:glutaredoxin|uniref:Methylamine utilization protein MauE n=1 Tax=Alteromonas mediterranea TaxID=314275 RepID=A0AAC8XGP0_9ALTE|nr:MULTISPECIES: glutaredoxin [Alteromonas]AGP91940.1 glutaredoxin [Alteromonas mediterranea U8]MBR9784663.1 glutaredoxin [Gammaproteobacteria bacterium]MEA3379538.1 glutaredoxin [Pseudomonadota bacterium]AFV83714.1 glutaredoxin [Alteromonas mediterranea DE1]AGP80164.1 glutaredoxin [Alteromonas mediterranea MED64]|tara:strand:+ start:6031 stop:6774 length:744 start_codon:yes stop_codon:yes gene_type:complete
MSKRATLYRMVMPNHICPFGLKSKDLLERKGFEVNDHHLTSRSETDAFKEKHEVKTTPQTFIDDKRIGGYDDLRDYFNLKQESEFGSRYTPIIVIFSLAALMVAALMLKGGLAADVEPFVMNFIGITMVILALQKLQDLVAFSNQFITYDLLAMKHVRYAYVYPFAEAYAGLGMLAGLPALMVSPVSIFIGAIGAVSVIKAVYVDKRELKCACVGGNSDLPLGFISLTENLAMFGAGLYMLVNWLAL